MSVPPAPGLVLEMRHIVKDFPGVRALSGVSLGVRPGEIHALVGENGAGKSTLMKVLSGVHPHGTYEGEVLVDDGTCRFRSVRDSERAGITIIHQELALVKGLSIAENISLGSEPSRFGVVDWDAAWSRARTALDRVGLEADPDTPVGELGVGEQQLVEIARALSKDARIIILDEPTAALAEAEAERLMRILRELRGLGVTSVYISHRLREVLALADRVTVLRDGASVATEEAAGLTEERLVRLMVGRDLTRLYPERTARPARDSSGARLEIRDWMAGGTGRKVRVDRLVVRAGEVVGLAGLVGAGRSELAMSLVGLWGRVESGNLLVDGREVRPRTPAGAIAAGLCLVSEDRKRWGLVLGEDIRRNVSLASLERISCLGVVDRDREIGLAERLVAELNIRAPSVDTVVGHLSGGNQQKVVLAKWLAAGPRVLVLDEPTRGIDVGARAEIYSILNALAAEGVALLVISSDLQELLGICDRIAVMHEGRIAGELDAAGATQELVMALAAGLGLPAEPSSETEPSTA